MAAALHHRAGHRDPRDLAQQVAPLEADPLGPQVAGGVVGDPAARRRALEVGAEAGLLADGPEELGDVHHRRRQLLGPGPVGPLEQVRPLAAHHHRAGRVDDQHLGPPLHEGEEQVEVAVGLRPQRLEVALLPGRHPAAAQPLHHPGVDAVPLQHVRARPCRSAARCAARSRSGTAPPRRPARAGRAPPAPPRRRTARRRSRAAACRGGRPPPSPCRTRNGRTRFMALAMPKLARARRAAPSGIVEHAHPQRLALAAPPHPAPAVDQLGEVELELVLVTRRVRALDLAELALEAGVHHRLLLRGGDLLDVAVVPLVDGLEEQREAVAVLEAHAAAVTDLEGAVDLAGQRLRLPSRPGRTGRRRGRRSAGRRSSSSRLMAAVSRGAGAIARDDEARRPGVGRRAPRTGAVGR